MSELDLNPGATLPPFVRTSTFEAWNRFASVNHEFVPIHMDEEAGQKAGFPGAIGMGNLVLAYYHNLLRQWLGSAGRIDEVNARFQEPSLRNAVVTVQGRVTSATPTAEGSTVVLELWAEDDSQRRLSSGQAAVTVFA